VTDAQFVFLMSCRDFQDTT